jgi:hypothetical protein
MPLGGEWAMHGLAHTSIRFFKGRQQNPIEELCNS